MTANAFVQELIRRAQIEAEERFAAGSQQNEESAQMKVTVGFRTRICKRLNEIQAMLMRFRAQLKPLFDIWKACEVTWDDLSLVLKNKVLNLKSLFLKLLPKKAHSAQNDVDRDRQTGSADNLQFIREEINKKCRQVYRAFLSCYGKMPWCRLNRQSLNMICIHSANITWN